MRHQCGLACEQALCLGKKQRQRPVHWLVWVRLYVTTFQKGISKLCAVWNLPGRRTKLNITNLHNFRFVLNVSVLSNLEILPRACEKHIQTRFSLQHFRFWGISSILCRQKMEPQIQFQQPSLTRSPYFLIVIGYLSYLDQVFLPITVLLLYIRIKLNNNFENAHCEFYEKFHVGNASCSYKASSLRRKSFRERNESRAAKTENPVPRSFFAPRPNRNTCYAGYQFSGPIYLGAWNRLKKEGGPLAVL